MSESDNPMLLMRELQRLAVIDDIDCLLDADNMSGVEHDVARLINMIMEKRRIGHIKRESAASLAAMKAMVNYFDTVILATDPETGAIIFISDRAKDLFNVGGNPIGRRCYEYLYGYSKRCDKCLLDKVKENPGKALHTEVYYPTFGKSFRVTTLLIDWPAVGMVHLEFGVEITDTVQQKRAMESVLNGIDALITVADPYTNEILFLNDAIRENFGIKGDGVGQICHKLLQGLDEPCEHCPYLQLRSEPDSVVKWEHKESIKGDLLLKTAKLIDWLDGRKAHLEYAINVTETRNMEKDIQQLKAEVEKVYYDPLTEIYSRRFFEENIEQLIGSLSRANGVLSLMIADIDFFKPYNDTYGHIKGDECLKNVATAIKSCTMRKEDFTARYGGEEFVIVLPNTNESGARMIAENMLARVRELTIPHDSSSVADCVTISIGVVTGAVKYTHNRDDYLNLADKMLYESKQSGRNRYTITEL